ncbi:TPA: hypothetical protein JI225_05075 [Acinetobacter baumannii]|nr:hypothetical protein ACX61_06275 [Acinetobacter baumannii]HAV6080457.1 hypothetical protein [Acinetobacter baumannii]
MTFETVLNMWLRHLAGLLLAIESLWSYWKPKSPRQDLVRAAALLIAEIERLDREVKAESKEG